MLVNKINLNLAQGTIYNTNYNTKPTTIPNIKYNSEIDTVCFTSNLSKLKTLDSKFVAAVKKAAQQNDALQIFKICGMKPQLLKDNTISLAKFDKPGNGITFRDFGINEQTLMENVSEIIGNANFEDLILSQMPKLKRIGGSLKLGKLNMQFPLLEEVTGNIQTPNNLGNTFYSMPALRKSGTINANNIRNLDNYEECTGYFNIATELLDRTFPNFKKTFGLWVRNKEWACFSEKYKPLIGKTKFPALEEIGYAMRYDTGEGIEMLNLKQFNGNIVYDVSPTLPDWGILEFKGSITKKMPYNHC